jgi:hypothetical protein
MSIRGGPGVAALIVRSDALASRLERRNKANSRCFPHFLDLQHRTCGGTPFVTGGFAARLRMRFSWRNGVGQGMVQERD